MTAQTHLVGKTEALPSSQGCSHPAEENIRQPEGAHGKHRGGLKITVSKCQKDWTGEKKGVRTEKRRQKSMRLLFWNSKGSRICLRPHYRYTGKPEFKLRKSLPLKSSAILPRTKRNGLIREAINRILYPGTYKKGRERQSCY